MTKLLEEILSLFQQHADIEKAQKMAAYQKNQFAFYGIPTPLRRQLTKNLLKEKAKETEIDWSFVFSLWHQNQRECQYLACDYLHLPKMRNLLVPTDLPQLKQLVIQKSWWDSVDSLDELVGQMTKTYPNLKQTLVDWSCADNLWLRRLAINHQLGFKRETDQHLLAQIIKHNIAGSLFEKEFFINKAIGWALRDYSKSNPQWVAAFIAENADDMTSLSIREASKYLKEE